MIIYVLSYSYYLHMTDFKQTDRNSESVRTAAFYYGAGDFPLSHVIYDIKHKIVSQGVRLNNQQQRILSPQDRYVVLVSHKGKASCLEIRGNEEEVLPIASESKLELTNAEKISSDFPHTFDNSACSEDSSFCDLVDVHTSHRKVDIPGPMGHLSTFQWFIKECVGDASSLTALYFSSHAKGLHLFMDEGVHDVSHALSIRDIADTLRALGPLPHLNAIYFDACCLAHIEVPMLFNGICPYNRCF